MLRMDGEYNGRARNERECENRKDYDLLHNVPPMDD
jgi:hypothetical protein